ncbi:MAG: AI-2E family transporter [Geobacteraceae bacterium]|nr:AI-2E family transporter [Geobacteraceae bacterium]
MDRKVFFALVAFSFLLFLLYFLYVILAPFLVPLGWAGVIGILTFPIYKRLHRRFHDRDMAAAWLMTPLVVLTLVLPVVGLVLFLTREATQAYRVLEEATASGELLVLENIRQHPAVAPWLERIRPYVDLPEIDLHATMVPAMKKVTSFVLGYSTELIKNFFAFLVKLILMVIALFFIYKDGERFQQEFWSIMPIKEADKGILVDTVRRVLSAVVYGIFLTCLVQGALGGIGFWFSGLPSPLLFGAMMAVCALIPLVGTALIWLPAAIYLLLQDEVVKGLILMAWGALVVASIDNFLRPFFISGKARLPVLVIALGALGGLVSFGLLGVVIGPIVLALFMALFEIYKGRIFPGDGPDSEADRGA